MKGDSVPPAHHVLRYVGGIHFDEDTEGNTVINGAGFIAKPHEDNKPSCNWLEYLSGNLEQQIQRIRDTARIQYGATARLARLNVGCIIREVANGTESCLELMVIHDPLDVDDEYPIADPSHALILNVPNTNDPEGELVGDLIADCVLQLFPARTP